MRVEGPTALTLDDFWQMIWQEKSRLIIMLCNLVEKGKNKCEQYWPDVVGETVRASQPSILKSEFTVKGQEG